MFKMFKNNTKSKKETLVVLGLFIPFSTGNSFLGKFGPKTQNYQFKLKFCT